MMKTKRIIQEKLEFHKRQSMTYEMLNKCANHLYDAYRGLEMALQYCDNPEVRERVEKIRDIIGKDVTMAGYVMDDTPTAISLLRDILSDIQMD